MSKHILKFLSPSIAFFFLLFANSLNAGEPPPTSKLTKADYDKLCDFYKEITKKPIDMNTKEVELMDAVYYNLPDLFNELYDFAAWTNPKARYDFIKDYAKQVNKITWECGVAKQYYINDFKKNKM